MYSKQQHAASLPAIESDGDTVTSIKLMGVPISTAHIWGRVSIFMVSRHTVCGDWFTLAAAVPDCLAPSCARPGSWTFHRRWGGGGGERQQSTPSSPAAGPHCGMQLLIDTLTRCEAKLQSSKSQNNKLFSDIVIATGRRDKKNTLRQRIEVDPPPHKKGVNCPATTPEARNYLGPAERPWWHTLAHCTGRKHPKPTGNMPEHAAPH